MRTSPRPDGRRIAALLLTSGVALAAAYAATPRILDAMGPPEIRGPLRPPVPPAELVGEWILVDPPLAVRPGRPISLKVTDTGQVWFSVVNSFGATTSADGLDAGRLRANSQLIDTTDIAVGGWLRGVESRLSSLLAQGPAFHVIEHDLTLIPDDALPLRFRRRGAPEPENRAESPRIPAAVGTWLLVEPAPPRHPVDGTVLPRSLTITPSGSVRALLYRDQVDPSALASGWLIRRSHHDGEQFPRGSSPPLDRAERLLRAAMDGGWVVPSDEDELILATPAGDTLRHQRDPLSVRPVRVPSGTPRCGNGIMTDG